MSQTTLTVRYTVAIRQAPHPRLSFCALKTQIRWLLACDLYSLYYVQPHALRPLKYSFGARHIIYNIKNCLTRQDTRYVNNACVTYYMTNLSNAQVLSALKLTYNLKLLFMILRLFQRLERFNLQIHLFDKLL